ncbi:hypothetical protein PoB_005747200 [Plakobranchus ocellatus]|uniref:Uncharacterized protein n=1 Tax=Plakobranchus ocellatus TaxID=259542 RepID=A0AAV4CHQ9_9GAST|nr:hypothetical protein PoB_005747200 [Plakobranchus ocellatus]
MFNGHVNCCIQCGFRLPSTLRLTDLVSCRTKESRVFPNNGLAAFQVEHFRLWLQPGFSLTVTPIVHLLYHKLASSPVSFPPYKCVDVAA